MLKERVMKDHKTALSAVILDGIPMEPLGSSYAYFSQDKHCVDSVIMGGLKNVEIVIHSPIFVFPGSTDKVDIVVLNDDGETWRGKCIIRSVKQVKGQFYHTECVVTFDDDSDDMAYFEGE